MDLPELPAFRPIELEDREAIEEAFAHDQPIVSELTFANLYLWRGTSDPWISRLGNTIIFRVRDLTSEHFFLPPVGAADIAGTIRGILTCVSNDGTEPSVRRVPEDTAHELKAQGFQIEIDRDNSDYIYLAKDLIELPGRKYHRKRNHITRFRAEYDYIYTPITPDLAPECKQLQESWCDIRDCSIPENRSLAEENQAVMEALSHIDSLDLTGGAILIDGKVAAFSLGGKLNDQTFVVHFEKASPVYPGLYQVMNQEFCANAAMDYDFVNREQDMGDPGLRQSKESYFPHHMVHKYTVKPRQ